jgi:ABC-2 type transport system permease protein
MSLWRLEWLRLSRSRRLIVLIVVYVFFGLTGPLSARYIRQILDRVGGGIKVELPPATPVDGLAQFTSNASQICLLVVVLVAAAGLSLDARPELAIFLRTRVPHVRAVIVPAYVTTSLVAAGAFVLGALAAWYETAVLLGALPVGRTLAAIALTCLFLAFAVAVTAAAAYLVRGVLATAGVTIVLLLVLALLGNFPSLGKWTPTTLLGSLPGLAGGAPWSSYLWAALVTVLATAGALVAAVRLADRREL